MSNTPGRPPTTDSDLDGRGQGVHFEGDLRRALMDAAIVALENVGVEGLSLRGLARSIGVSHAAPAHHFVDKAGLLTAIATEGFELFVTRLQAVPAFAPDDGMQGLGALGLAYAQFADDHPGHFEVMFRPSILRATEPGYVRSSRAAYGALRDHIARYQRDGWRAAQDLDSLTTAVWGLVHGLSVLRAGGSLEPRHPAATVDDLVGIAASLIMPES
ncbi:MAG: TetR/AcrR family transcriptional regulator [Microthrixaceae bacterium]